MATTEHLDERTYHLLFGIRRSVRYHQHRRRFYENWNALTVAAAAVLGTSAAGSLIGGLPDDLKWIAASASGVVGILAALDLAVGTARRADQHGELARRFIHLEQTFAHDRSLDDEEFEAATNRRLEIEASEPSVLALLDAVCHYEILRSYGDRSEQPRIPRLNRLAMHWFSQDGFVRSLDPAGTPSD